MCKKGGVAKLLSDRVPDQISTHCVAHRLELSCLDTAKDVPYMEQFNDVNGIFHFYYYSFKKHRELAEISAIIDEGPAHFGGIQHVRWLLQQSCEDI